MVKDSRTEIKPKNILLFWVLATTLGALVGATVALSLFPTAAFRMNPVGQYGANVFGFAVCLALPFAIGQWLALRRFLKYLGLSTKKDWLWLLVTASGMVATVLPLWSLDARAIAWFPAVVISPLLPGSILLGITQWIFLAYIFGFRNTWMWALLTTLGVILGSFVVLSFYPPLLFMTSSINVFWYTGVALSISSLQVSMLKKLAKIASIRRKKSKDN